MQDVFKNWRSFLIENQRPGPGYERSKYELTEEEVLTEEEIALIAESRIDDAKKKYSGVERFVDRLAEKDPSKNNKYLMWMMKQLDLKMQSYIRVAGDDAPTEAEPQDAYFTGLFNYTIRLGEAIEDFHKNAQRLKNKDINSYKALKDIENINRDLGFSKRHKRRGEKIKALEDVEIILENDYFYVARPYTVEAAAELGGARGATSWCIARGRCGDEWFSKYTGEGKAFYYVLSKFLPRPPKSDSSMQALTYQHGELHAINDGDNKDIDEGEFEENFYEVMFAGAVSNPDEAVEAWNDMDTDAPTPKIIQKVITALVRDFGDEYDESIEDVRDVDEIYDIGGRIISSLMSEIMYAASDHVEWNPAGPREEDFNEILNEFDFNHIDIQLMDPADYGGEQWSWSAYAHFQLPPDLPWIDAGDGQPASSDYEDEITTIFQEKTDIEGGRGADETEFDSYDESVRMEFRPDYDENEGADGFKNFCQAMKNFDDRYNDVMEAAMKEIGLSGFIESEAYNKRKELYASLPDFKNFDTKLEKGSVKIFTKFSFDLIGFLEAIKFHDLIDDRSEREKQEAVLSTQQTMFMQRQTRNVERDLSGWQYGNQNSAIANDWIAEMAMVFASASREAQKQMDLPLTEAQKWEPLHSAPSLKFLAPDITASPDEKITGTILFELAIKLDKLKQQDTIRFVTWIDKHFGEAMSLLKKSILQTAELRGKTAKREEPQLFVQPPEDIEREKEEEKKQEASRRESQYLMGTPGGAEEHARRNRGEDPKIYDPQTEEWIPAHPGWEIGILNPGESLPEDWTYVPGAPTPRRNPEGLDESKQNKLVTHKNIFESWRKFTK